MSSGTIFLVGSNGELTRMSPGAPSTEDHMQTLVAKHPQLIVDADGDLLLIRREQAVADKLDGGGRWSLDHLFVTREAVPVLVELKRATDTRLRREVVGQMLDYAANGVAYWKPGAIRQSFVANCEKQGLSAEKTFAEFIGQDEAAVDEAAAAKFWDDVDTHLRDGRIKLVFVADTIPPELARIVEFLNLQMQCEVRAIELNWYNGEGGVTTLAPRIIGETQRAADEKNARAALDPLTAEQWIEKNMIAYGPAAVAGAEAYLSLVGELGGEVRVAKLQGSLIATFVGSNGKPYYPMHLWKDGAFVSPSFGYLVQRPGLVEVNKRQQIYDSFAAVVGPLSTTNLQGFPGFPAAILADPEKRAALIPVVRDLVEAARPA